MPNRRGIPGRIRLSSRGRGMVAALGAAVLVSQTAAMAVADDPPTGRQVAYRGAELDVPKEWKVVDLDKSPHACLRLDTPTLYLGHPRDQADCAGSRVAPDRADSVHVEPLDGAADRADIPTVTVLANQRLPDPLPKAPSGEIRFVLKEQKLVATIGYGTSPDVTSAVVNSVLDQASGGHQQSKRPVEASAALAAPAAPAQRAALRSAEPVTQGAFKGRGFDACTAPTPAQMETWRDKSPYQGVGIYIGGSARACAQPQLTTDWIRDQSADGWHLMPIWVGPQPWDTSRHSLPTSRTAAERQGRTEADGAVPAARSLGLGESTVLYNDVESYDDRDKWDGPVLSYLSGWTDRLHEEGYRSGAYVAKSSGVQALSFQYGKGKYTMPDVLWTANWDNSPDTDDRSMGLPEDCDQWTDSRRAHQYAGNTQETYGEVSLNIDRNSLDVGTDAADLPFSKNATAAMTSGDFNGDGRSDVAVVGKDGSLYAYDAKPDGMLAYGQRLWGDGTWGSMRQVVGGDFTGDGVGDIAAVWDDGSIHLYQGTKNGMLTGAGTMWPDHSWTTIKHLTAWRSPSGLDGLLAVWHDGSLHRYEADADGALKAVPGTMWRDNSWASVQHIATGDFTGDGRTDTVAVWFDGQLRVYPGTAQDTLGDSKPLWHDRSWDGMPALTAGDFTGDGHADLMALWPNNVPYLYSGSGQGQLKPGIPSAG